MSNPIVLYDGVCAFCSRIVQFLLKRDRNDRLLFASLQSDFAAKILKRHGLDAHDLETVCVVKNYEDPDETLLTRSDAILSLGEQLGGIWSLAVVGKLLPRALRDWLYNLVARNRYRVFGKYDSCMLPEGRYRRKFLDTGAPDPERERVKI